MILGEKRAFSTPRLALVVKAQSIVHEWARKRHQNL
jgi:hypothetical protein